LQTKAPVYLPNFEAIKATKVAVPSAREANQKICQVERKKKYADRTKFYDKHIKDKYLPDV